MARPKYNNKKTVYNGQKFDSKKEARRAFELDCLLKLGTVLKYETQVPLSIDINGIHVCKYIADFKVYYPDGRIDYEDVKGFKTAMYRLKKKLVKASLGIEIIEK